MYLSLLVKKGLVKLRRTKPRKGRVTRSKSKVKKTLLDSTKLRDWSLAIRARDKKCKSCGTKNNLHAHHIVSKYYNPHLAYNLNNGVALCEQCHIGKGGVHDKRNPPKNKTIASLRRIYLSNRPRKKRYRRYKPR